MVDLLDQSFSSALCAHEVSASLCTVCPLAESFCALTVKFDLYKIIIEYNYCRGNEFMVQVDTAQPT